MNQTVKKAGKWSGIGLGLTSLAGIFEAVAHHAKGNFETLGQSFAHVASPENILLAVGISTVIGTSIALFNRYHKQLDKEDANSIKPMPPRKQL